MEMASGASGILGGGGLAFAGGPGGIAIGASVATAGAAVGMLGARTMGQAVEALRNALAAKGGENGGPQRGVGGSGWRGDAQWKGAVKQVNQGGTIRSINGRVPTVQEATDLINEGGGRVVRVDPPHEAPNPHDFPHINYETSNGLKGTIEILEGTQ